MRHDLNSGSTGDAMLRDAMLPDAMLRDAMSTTMRAAVCVTPGGPEVLEIRELPVPVVREGWSLVPVRGAGLNRSGLRAGEGRDGAGVRRRLRRVCVAAELAADAGHHHVAVGHLGRATRDVPDRAG